MSYPEIRIKDEKDIFTLYDNLTFKDEGIIGVFMVTLPKIGGKFTYKIPIPFFDIFEGVEFFPDEVKRVTVFTDYKIIDEMYPKNDGKLKMNYTYTQNYKQLYLEIYSKNNLQEISFSVYAGILKKRKKIEF